MSEAKGLNHPERLLIYTWTKALQYLVRPGKTAYTSTTSRHWALRRLVRLKRHLYYGICTTTGRALIHRVEGLGLWAALV